MINTGTRAIIVLATPVEVYFTAIREKDTPGTDLVKSQWI
jgi:hypothetical protein